MNENYSPSAVLRIEMDLIGHLLPLVISVEIPDELAKTIKENKAYNARFIVAMKSTFPQLALPNNNPALFKKAE